MDPASTSPSLVGRTLAHFRIVRQIGAGGMGVVYEAEDQKLGRRVALKFIPEALAHDPEMMSRFRREARAASALNHPNICSVFAIEQAGASEFIVMELMQGQTLRERIREKPLPLDEALRLAIEWADAVAAAHNAGIIHRDIKPANLFVNAAGHGKILDFGVAKIEAAAVQPDATTRVTAGEPFQTEAATAIGTLGYMAPEQARGLKMDSRADLFSLGAVLYEMISGHAPFPGQTAAVVYDALLNRVPAAASSLNPKVTPEMDHILARALEKDPELRYQTAHDLRADLMRLERGTSASNAVKVRTNPRRWIAGGALAAIVMAVLFYTHRASSNGVPRVEFEEVTSFTASASAPAVSRDGRTLAFLLGDEQLASSAKRGVQLYVKTLPSGEAIRLTSTNDTSKNWPEFSLDQGRIAFTTLERGFIWNVWQAPILGGQPTRMLANAGGLTWIDADHVMFSEIDQPGSGHMQLVAARENRTEERIIYNPEGDGMAHASSLSPDKRSVLVVEMDIFGWLPCRLVPFDGSSRGSQVGPPAAQCTAAKWSPDGEWMYFVSQAGGAFHIWRQRFPDGTPQQLTSGAAQEDGLSVGPDGSLYTASGIEESSIWLHDAHGERQITNEGYAFLPSFSSDNRKVYYLVRGGAARSFVSGELWAVNLESGDKEHLLPGIVMQHYHISRDGTRVLYVSGNGGESGLWLADLDLRHPPKRLTHSGEVRGYFGRPGEILYLKTSEPQRAMRMREDGSSSEPISNLRVLNITSVSPGGEWIGATVVQNENAATELLAIHVEDGSSIVLCGFCIIGAGPARTESPPIQWRGDGKALFVALRNFGIHSNSTAVFSLQDGPRPYPIAPAGLRTEADVASLPGVTLLPDGNAFPGVDASKYLASRHSARMNIYRLRITGK